VGRLIRPILAAITCTHYFFQHSSSTTTMLNRFVRSSAVPQLARGYAGKWPRPKPGTSEKPPYYAPDPLVNNPKAAVTPLSTDGSLEFIHRPPPTIASPLSLTTNPVSPLLRPPSDGRIPLPPYLRKSAHMRPEKRLSDEELAELQRLRKKDPRKHSQARLAETFGCTKRFVSLKAALPKPLRKKALIRRELAHEKIRADWSDQKRLDRDIRKKRQEFW